MFRIELRDSDEVALTGRFDASRVDEARSVFDTVTKSCIVDFEDLDYISSGGLSVLLATQKRLRDAGHQLILRNMSDHVREVFKYAGFNVIFEIQ